MGSIEWFKFMFLWIISQVVFISPLIIIAIGILWMSK